MYARSCTLCKLLAVLVSLALADAASNISGVCPNECEALPQKSKSAAGLAVSLVVMTTCEGDIDGAARAVASAAADGDQHSFSAGLTVGAAALTGADADGHGQMAQIISQTLTIADSNNKTTAVAAALGNALASMKGNTAQIVVNETITAINDLADASCSAATTVASSIFFPIKQSNPPMAAFFVMLATAHGNKCWVRRFNRLKDSKVFVAGPANSSCTRRMQDASATSLSLVTASACRLDKSKPVAAAAYALVTAAVRDNCSFASAVAASTSLGLPSDSLKEVYRAAITKAGVDRKQSQLGNAFAATFTQLDRKEDGAKLLQILLTAVDETIKVSGCNEPKAFTKGLFYRLVELDPTNVKSIKAAFAGKANIAACKYPL